MKPVTKRFLSFSWTLVVLWIAARLMLSFLLPFLLGLGLALASEGAVDFLCKKGRLPRSFASILGVSATVAGGLGLGALVFALALRQLGSLGVWLPPLTSTVARGRPCCSGGCWAWEITFPRPFTGAGRTPWRSSFPAAQPCCKSSAATLWAPPGRC